MGQFIRILLCAVILLCSSPSFSGIHRIPHIPEGNWKTTIELCNDGVVDEIANIEWWDVGGSHQNLGPVVVSGGSSVVVSCNETGIANVAQVLTATESMLKVKLSYQYLNSESLCEFMISDDSMGTRWLIPNSHQDHFDWFGLAIGSFGETNVSVILKCYRAGSLLGETELEISPFERVVDVSSGFWEGVAYPDVDLVIVESDDPIPAPVSITGNSRQDRHVFFLADHLKPNEEIMTYQLHHIATDKWRTTLCGYNAAAEQQEFRIASFEPDGSIAVLDAVYTVQPDQQLTLTAGLDFPFGGSATISAPDNMSFKLSYQYRHSDSLCEFFLEPTVSRQWFMPCIIPEWFDWTGLAVGNPYEQEISVTLRALKNSNVVGVVTKRVPPLQKAVQVVESLWPGLIPSEVDMIVIQSENEIGPPILIMGNEEQDRHVFFNAVADFPFEGFIPDPSFRAFLMDNLDTNGNGVLDFEETNPVIGITTPGFESMDGNFRDITGIELFPNLQWLYCPFEKLTFLPDMSRLTELEQLVIVGNDIAFLPDLSGLKKLEWLNCGFNPLRELPDLSHLKALLELDIDLCRDVSDIPGLDELTQLLALSASGTALWDCSELINAQDLAYLDLGGTAVRDVSFIQELQQLIKLDLSLTPVEELPSLSKLTLLEELYCSGIPLNTMPDLSAQTNLLTLEVMNCRLGQLAGLENATQLVNLNCSNNQLSSLPDLSLMTDLVIFEAFKNQLEEVRGLEYLTSLQELNLAENQLTSVPDISQLTELRKLNLNDNQLSVLPDFSTFTELQELAVEGNPAVETISGISNLTKLLYLSISRTGIETLEDLSSLSSLDFLALWATPVCEIPGLENLQSLRMLDCSSTSIASLDGIGSLQNLEWLLCGFADLENVPDVRTCSSLRGFHCAYNHFGPDDCGLIQAIEAMDLDVFEYNPQIDETELVCE